MVFVKAPSFSIKALRTVVRTKRRITLIIARPSGPGNHNGAVRCAPIGRYTLSRNVRMFRPIGVERATGVRCLEGFGTSVVVIITFKRVLSGDVLSVPQCNYVGIRTSLLPGCENTTPVR